MSESIQKKLLRVRPPRVRITYDVETGGAVEKRELPFIAGILADLSGDREDPAAFPSLKERAMTKIDRDNFNDVMKKIGPRVSLAKLTIPLLQTPAATAADKALVFQSLEDFEPLKVVQALPSLNALYQARSQIRSLQTKAEADDAMAAYLDALVQHMLQSPPEKRDELIAALDADKPALPQGLQALQALQDKLAENDDNAADSERRLLRLRYFARHVLASLRDAGNKKLQQDAQKGGAAAAIDEQVVQIDRSLSEALSAIMHCDGFKRVEATWRGLAYLVFRTDTSPMLRLRVLNATQDELRKDMEKAVEFDQSTLFKMLYEEEYGTFGGYPYSLLVGGYEIGYAPDDIEFLKKIAEVAAAAHAPFIAAASNSLFGLSSFDKLDKPRDLKKIFEGEEMAGWREFRSMEDARYVTLVLPQVLLRLPYGKPDKRNTIPCEGLNFEEDMGGSATPRNVNFLWGNAAYVLAERIMHAFSLYNWTAAIRGVEGGGLVDGLPQYTFTSDSGTTELFCPTEVAITDRREKELNDLGFISLCHCKGTGKAAFFGGQTTNQPKKYFSDEANANAKISAMLPYILAASRFAHYIKVIMRDKIGSFVTRANVESYLNTWIANYVLLDDNATQEVKSSYPLRSASVIVTDAPGEPGAYRATVFLKPHFQLEELTTSIRLVANLPK